jgi:hypothetical protein
MFNEVFSGYQPGKVVQFNNPGEEDRDGLRNVGL